MSSRLDDLTAWRIFVTFAKVGTISGCAQALDLEPSTISRAISSLEKGIGQSLIVHHSRPMELTKAGKKALARIQPILRTHQQLIESLTADAAAMSCHVRFSAPPGFSTRRLMPFLARFHEIYPNISVDLVVGMKEDDIAKELCEVGVLTGEPTLPGLTYMSRGRNVYLPVATPEYIAKHGMPIHPCDLAKHNVFLYSGPVRKETKSLVRGTQEVMLELPRVVRMVDIIAIREALLNHMGVAVDMPLVQIYEDIEAGRLVPILPGWMKQPEECFIVTTRSNWHIRRVRMFLEWYALQMQAEFAHYEQAVSGIVGLPPQRNTERNKVFHTSKSL